MKVYLDMDGVVADFSRGAARKLRKPWPYDDVKNLGDAGWDLIKLWGLKTPENLFGSMDQKFWESLDTTKEASSVVATLTSAFGVENICFLSAPCNTKGCAEGKRNWAHKYFPDIPLLLAMPSAFGRDAPKHMLAGPDTLLIDDYTVNTDNFTGSGGKAFLFPRPWNNKFAEEPRAEDKLSNFVKRIRLSLYP